MYTELKPLLQTSVKQLHFKRMRKCLFCPMSVYDTVYKITASIPAGKVMSYGQIAGLIPGCTARMVGYAMSAAPQELELPWWRVVNSRLKISLRGAGDHHILQKKLLQQEGVVFDKTGHIAEVHRLEL